MLFEGTNIVKTICLRLKYGGSGRKNSDPQIKIFEIFSPDPFFEGGYLKTFFRNSIFEGGYP